MRKMNCLRCESEMVYLKTEKIQLGQTGWILGDLPNLFAGAMETEIYMCKGCGKVEFFATEPSESNLDLPQRTCPKCGHTHDFDYPKCPHCKFDYYGK